MVTTFLTCFVTLSVFHGLLLNLLVGVWPLSCTASLWPQWTYQMLPSWIWPSRLCSWLFGGSCLCPEVFCHECFSVKVARSWALCYYCPRIPLLKWSLPYKSPQVVKYHQWTEFFQPCLFFQRSTLRFWSFKNLWRQSTRTDCEHINISLLLLWTYFSS